MSIFKTRFLLGDFLKSVIKLTHYWKVEAQLCIVLYFIVDGANSMETGVGNTENASRVVGAASATNPQNHH